MTGNYYEVYATRKDDGEIVLHRKGRLEGPFKELQEIFDEQAKLQVLDYNGEPHRLKVEID